MKVLKMLARIMTGLLFFIMTGVAAIAAPVEIPQPPNIKARSYILIDYHSGQVLAELNPDQRIEPASITKMMVAYIVEAELTAGRIRENDMVRISEKAWRMEGSRTFVDVNSTVPLIDLLKGLIVQSGNDATVALAEHAAGSEESFVDLMNKHAKRLGLKDTHFSNVTGLPDPQHYSTARDLATLAKAVIRDNPRYYSMYSIKEYVYNNITQYNRNRLLLRDPTVDGIKTGHTESAGFCLVASAQRNGMRLVSVVLGTESDNARIDYSDQLLNYGYRFHETRRVYSGGKKLSIARVWKGDPTEMSLGLRDDLYITYPRGQQGKIDTSLEISKKLVAPVRKGEVVGAVKIMRDGKLVSQRPLVTLTAVGEGGLFRRGIDNITMMFD